MARKAKVGDTIRIKAGVNPCGMCPTNTPWCSWLPNPCKFWSRARIVAEVVGNSAPPRYYAESSRCGLRACEFDVVARAGSKKGDAKQ